MSSRLKKVQARRESGEAGFTLIELLVVIIILGILAAVVVFAVAGAGDKGEEAAYRTDVRTLRTAEEAFFARNDFYGTQDDLVNGGFLSERSQLNEIVLAIDKQSYSIGAPGGTMVIATNQDASGSLNPAVTTGGGTHANTEPTFNGLYSWSPTNKLTPDLAASAPVFSPDGLNLTITLRPDGTVFFHDDGNAGTDDEFNADDVKFTYERALLPHHGRTGASMRPALNATGSGATTVVDPSRIVASENGTAPDTVQFIFTAPYLRVLQQLNVTEAPILPQHVYGACTLDTISGTGCAPNNPTAGVDFPSARPIGTGPFRFKSRSSDNGLIRWERHPNYHQAPLPFLDSLTAKFIANNINVSAHTEALEAGDVDWAADVSVDFARLSTSNPRNLQFASVSRFTGGSNCMSTLAFNLLNWDPTPPPSPPPVPTGPGTGPGDRAILGGINGENAATPADGYLVRKAIAKAVDRQRGFEDVQASQGALATAPIHSNTAGYSAGLTLPSFNSGDAGDLLTQAGWTGSPVRMKGVNPLALTLVHQNTQFPTGWASRIESDLESIGFDITLVSLAVGTTYNTRVFSDRDWDLTFISYCNEPEAQIGVRRQYHSTSVSSGAFTNASGYQTLTMDGLWDTARDAPNATAAATAYRSIQEHAIADLPYAWLVETVNVRAVASRCLVNNHLNSGLFPESASCRT